MNPDNNFTGQPAAAPQSGIPDDVVNELPMNNTSFGDVNPGGVQNPPTTIMPSEPAPATGPEPVDIYAQLPETDTTAPQPESDALAPPGPGLQPGADSAPTVPDPMPAPAVTMPEPTPPAPEPMPEPVPEPAPEPMPMTVDSTPPPPAPEPTPPPVPEPMPAPEPPAPEPVVTIPDPAPAPDPIPEPAQSPIANDNTPSFVPVASDDAMPGELGDIKRNALQELTPLVQHLKQEPAEQFKTLLDMIRASDNVDLIKPAYEAAHAITDEVERAKALLEIVKEVNYLSQNKGGHPPSDEEE